MPGSLPQDGDQEPKWAWYTEWIGNIITFTPLIWILSPLNGWMDSSSHPTLAALCVLAVLGAYAISLQIGWAIGRFVGLFAAIAGWAILRLLLPPLWPQLVRLSALVVKIIPLCAAAGVVLILLYGIRPGGWIRAVLDSGDSSDSTTALRVFTQIGAGLFGVIFVLMLAFGSRTAYTCFRAAASWFIVLLLAKIASRSAGTAKTFGGFLIKNSFELILVFMCVSLGMVMASFAVDHIPPDTLHKVLLQWKDRNLWLVNHLARLSPGPRLGFLIVGLVYWLEAHIQKKFGERAGRRTESAWKWYKAGQKWVQRANLVMFFVVSFTFLDARADGPAAKLEARLDSDAREYRDLRVQIQNRIEERVRYQLYSSPPPEIVRAIKNESSDRSLKFEQRISEPRERVRAESALDMPARKEALDRADTISLSRLRKCREAVNKLVAKVPPEWLASEFGHETANKILEMPTKAFLEILAGDRPVLRKFVEAVSKSITGDILERLEQSSRELRDEMLRTENPIEIDGKTEEAASLIAAKPLELASTDIQGILKAQERTWVSPPIIGPNPPMDNPVQKTLAIDKLRKKREELRRLREFGDDESIASAGLTDALVEIALRKPDQTRLALISELLDSCRAQVDSLVRNSSPQSAQSVIAIVGEREYDQVKNKPLMSLVPPVPKDTIEPKSKPSEIPVRPERIH